MIKLPKHLRQMGELGSCGHRSGWAYVLKNINKIEHNRNILIDDFVERTFQYDDNDQIWDEEWVGIFHHPVNLPTWLDKTAPLQTIIKSQRFSESRKNLKAIITFSYCLSQFLEKELNVKSYTLKHPSEIPDIQFNFNNFQNNEYKSIVQVGYFARNYRGIYQIQTPDCFKKIHLYNDKPWINQYMKKTDEHSPFKNYPDFGKTTIVKRLSDLEYDLLLSESIVFCEYFDVAASNTIIECIARNTPIIVNKLPSTIEYLGDDYPLFYNRKSEVYEILKNRNLIEQAYNYLLNMDKDWLNGSNFRIDLLSILQQIEDENTK